MCVYYDKIKYLRAKNHAIVIDIGDGLHAIYKYGPPSGGYYPESLPFAQRFIAFVESRPLYHMEKVR